jgi:hypothetical protein
MITALSVLGAFYVGAVFWAVLRDLLKTESPGPSHYCPMCWLEFDGGSRAKSKCPNCGHVASIKNPLKFP